MIRLFLAVLVLFVNRVNPINGTTSEDVSLVLEKLVELDMGAAKPSDITLDYQNMASHIYFDHDNAPRPLFSSVSDRINGAGTFVALRKLQELYQTPDINLEEQMSPQWERASNGFIEAILYTEVMQRTWLFLGQAGLVSLDAQTFKKQLFDMWFGQYARGNATGSSGFENVFVGEINGTQVVGLNNWYRFYLLEQQGHINYHGWFKRINGVQISLQFAWYQFEAMEDSFLIGSSPEFEIAAYTICALSQLKECLFVRENSTISIRTETIIPPGGTIKIKSVYAEQYSGPRTTTEQQGSTKTPLDGTRLQKLVDDMRAADVDKPTDYLLNWGRATNGTEDMSPDPLFKFVNETIFERPVYKALIDVYNNGVYIPDVCNAEPPLAGGARETLLRNLLQTFANTTVFHLAFEYLKEIHYATDLQIFQEKLWTYWFGTYSRCKDQLGSSGFEHVFVGEWKGTKVGGHHCWVHYYLLEKTGDINYYGYISYYEQLTGTVQYTWGNYVKPIGGFNIGTSPAFDFALFSVCALTRTGNNGCRFTIDGFPMGVTSYLQNCANGVDICIASAYPTN